MFYYIKKKEHTIVKISTVHICIDYRTYFYDRKIRN